MLSRLLLLTISCFLSLPTLANQAHIAVASNFSHTMREIEKSFEADTGHKLLVSYGSSGKLYAQISHGAPFDVFLSADEEKPLALIKKQLAVSDSMFTYAYGRLVLWNTLAESPDIWLDSLNNADFRRLAIANPQLAPYGQAALEVLEYAKFNNMYKLVYGENIAQAFQFVESGNAGLGLVALSQIIQFYKNPPDRFKAVWRTIPDTLHAPIRQNAVLLEKGKSNPVAIALLDYLRSEKILQLIKDSGYEIVSAHQDKD